MLSVDQKLVLLGLAEVVVTKDLAVLACMDVIGGIVGVEDIKRILGYDVRRRCIVLGGRKYLRGHGKGYWSITWQGRRQLKDRIYERVFVRSMDVKSVINGISNI